MNSICFISNRYPNVLTPTRQVFVQKLVWTLADLGVDCTVISPVPVNQYFPQYKKLPLETTERSPNGSLIKLYFPRYISLGQKKILGFNTAYPTTNLFYKCVKKVFTKLKDKPEAVYGHFFTPAGITAARIGRAFNIPAFAAYGESTPWSVLNYGKSKIKKELASLAGVVSVSSANRDTLLKLNLIPQNKIGVFPNGYQAEKFYPRDKKEARKKFGFDQNAFIVSYVGQFSDRKGVLRAAAAAEGIEGVQIAFAGKGALEPLTANCIHKKPIPPSDIPDFLSASDLFVLPTLNEGCSNAVVEAMACGLPVVSANLPFNADILGEDNAILVDPNNVDEIKNAIVMLKDNLVLLKEKREGTLKRIKKLTLEARASNIKEWMHSRILED